MSKFFPLSVLLFLLILFSHPASAQIPPTIVFFTADTPPTLTVADAELGQIEITLRWKTVNAGSDLQARLEVLSLNTWLSLTKPDGVPFLPTDSFPTLYQHPLNFAPPTYRLSIVDAAGNLITQQFLTVPYTFDPNSPPPQIVAFSSDRQTLEIGEIQSGQARLTVSWEIAGRWPHSNLVFQQILDDGSRVSIELPRENLWIPSKGQGVVAPVTPGLSSLIQVQLQVIDVRDDTVLDEAALLLNISSANNPNTAALTTPPPTDVPAPERQSQTSSTDQQIISERPEYTIEGTIPTVYRFAFVPEPAVQGESIEIIWRVDGATSVAFDMVLPDGTRQNLMQAVPDAEGRFPVTLPAGTYYRLKFIMQVTNPAGDVLDMEKFITLKCEHTYVFEQKLPAMMCPDGAEQFVQGTFQEFEGGYLLRRADTDSIYVLYRGGRGFDILPDTYQQGETVTVSETPPPNYLAPQGRLAKLWLENPDVRQRLGWAIGQENIYVMTLQSEQVNNNEYTTYLLWPDNRLIFMRFIQNGAEWVGKGWGYVGR